VTDWVSHTQPEIVSRNLGIPVDEIRRLPKKELYIGTGTIATYPKPQNIDPVLEQSQSPHRFSLLHAHPEEFPGGNLRVVSQKEFPINSSLTSALMIIKPGGFRELHWHPNADEWQFVMSGYGQLTLFGSHGRVKTMDYDKGKIAFVKQGYGHFIENTGNEDLKLVIVFNSPCYQEITLRGWLAANPVQLVADHFGFDTKTVENIGRL